MSLAYILFITYWIIWGLLAIKPSNRRTWWLENIVVFVALPLVVLIYRAGLLSIISIVTIFVFATIHISAAHFVYSKTPWGEFLKRAFGWKRNHFDRIVHFLYGLMAVPIAADVFQHYLPSVELIKGLFIFSLIIGLGALYEILEFIAFLLSGRGDADKFIGMQGDIWDAQKDMLLQFIGAAIGVIFLIT